MSKRATTTGSAASDRAKREIGKVRRLHGQEEAARAAERSQAGLPSHDPRTAAGRRDYEVQSLGGNKRARNRRAQDLFKSRTEATTGRVEAVERFDTCWHMAKRGLLAPQSFEPGVDNSPTPGAPPLLDGVQAQLELERLERSIGPDAVALLYHCIVLGMSFRGLTIEDYGRPSSTHEGYLRGRFVAAVDAAATFYRYSKPSKLVQRMRAHG